MAVLSADTSPDVENMQIERLRQMPVWRKMALVGEMNRAVRALALAGLRQRQPGDTAGQLPENSRESRGSMHRAPGNICCPNKCRLSQTDV